MATFTGFVLEGTVLVSFALWWLSNILKTYWMCLDERKSYQSELSYTSTIRGRRVPLEIILKIALPFCGVWAEGGHRNFVYVGEDGNFFDQPSMQQMTIYGLFVVHGVSDLIDYLNITSLRDMKFATLAIAIGWYGLVFSFHERTVQEDAPLKQLVYGNAAALILFCVVVLAFEMFKRNSIITHLVRCLVVLTIGTWYFYAAFILYSPTPFPGEQPNPRWDQSLERNLQFTANSLGLHILGNTIVIVMAIYITESFRKCYRCCRPQVKGHMTSESEMVGLMDAKEQEGEDPVVFG